MATFKALLTLRTSCGCVGQGILGSGNPVAWDGDPVNETVQAILGLIKPDTLEVVDVLEMDGDDWRKIEDSRKATARIVKAVESGVYLRAALAKTMLSLSCLED